MARGINELPSGWMIKPLPGRSLVPATPDYARNVVGLPNPSPSNAVPDRASSSGKADANMGRFQSSPDWAPRKALKGPSR
jgi:hypothetical protein